jgi:hypothetical protein
MTLLWSGDIPRFPGGNLYIRKDHSQRRLSETSPERGYGVSYNEPFKHIAFYFSSYPGNLSFQKRDMNSNFLVIFKHYFRNIIIKLSVEENSCHIIEKNLEVCSLEKDQNQMDRDNSGGNRFDFDSRGYSLFQFRG